MIMRLWNILVPAHRGQEKKIKGEKARGLSNIAGHPQKDRVSRGQGNRHKPQPGTPGTTAREDIDRTSLCSSPFFSTARGVLMRPRWPGEISS